MSEDAGSQSLQGLPTLLRILIEPGTGHLLVPYINGALICLLLVIFMSALYGYASIHLAVLSFLALGLMVSINWFISEVNKIKNAEQVSEVREKGD
mmetsp:Transcript_57977/g.79017  ORF Transcript_57977/g.79017 Transcript_57977/m.79017 type:complete len:96 (+) Transcript_57977:12-299(+)